MLILTRRIKDAVIIDGDIKVTVLAVHGKQVRIGIEAPEDVLIVREELWDEWEDFVPEDVSHGCADKEDRDESVIIDPDPRTVSRGDRRHGLRQPG